MELEEIKFPEFAAWLQSQPDDIKFMDGLACETCPIAKFSGLSVAAWIHGLPYWASAFIDAFDERKQWTRAAALEVLAEVERKMAAESK
jgi:hypothetical protein